LRVVQQKLIPKVGSQVVAEYRAGHGCRADAEKDHEYELSDDVLPIHSLTDFRFTTFN
jgi:hypothetical protein